MMSGTPFIRDWECKLVQTFGKQFRVSTKAKYMPIL